MSDIAATTNRGTAMKMLKAAVAAAITMIAAHAGAEPITPGFSGNSIARNDDGATGAVSLGFSANYFGNVYTNAYISNNGYLTFNQGQGTYTPGGLGSGYSGQPIIAAFFADVDTRGAASALTTYGIGTYQGRNAFGATWNGVGYYSGQTNKLNNFQIIMTDRADTGAGNFDIFFNYDQIQWETGGASGGSNGLGGTSAAVGYNAGTGNQPGTFFELPGSRVPGSFLDTGTSPLIRTTNNGVPGQLQFNVRNGSVMTPDVPSAVPEPATWAMMLLGFGMVAGASRYRRRGTNTVYA